MIRILYKCSPCDLWEQPADERKKLVGQWGWLGWVTNKEQSHGRDFIMMQDKEMLDAQN